jgi:hypothetical protein
VTLHPCVPKDHIAGVISALYRGTTAPLPS